MQDIVIFIECPGRTSSLLSEGNNDPEIESPFASRVERARQTVMKIYSRIQNVPGVEVPP